MPTLRPGDIVVMDNLGAHKNEATLALIAAAGAQTRFLPAYSPDLNPIEMMWSKVKSPPPCRRSAFTPGTPPGNRPSARRGHRRRCQKLVGPLRLYFYLKCSKRTLEHFK